MKRRWKILIILGVGLAMVILIATVRHHQLRRATEAYVAQLKAQGEPMDLAQVLPPSLPPDQNSADIFRRAAALMETNEEWWSTNVIGGMGTVAPGKAMVVWRQPDVRNSISTNSWQTFGTALDRDKESLSLLRQIISKPDFDFQIDYAAGVADLDFPRLCLPQLKRSSQLLSGAAIYDLHNGDVDSAVENVRTALAIIQAMRHQRFEISELVRMAMAQIVLPSSWELLQATNITDAQLAELQASWENLDFVPSAANSMMMERASGLITTAKWRNSNAELDRSFFIDPESREDIGLEPEPVWDRIKIKSEIFMWRYWWSYPDELRQLQGYQVLIGAVRAAQTNGSFKAALENQTEKLNELGITNQDYNYWDLYSKDVNLHSMLSESVITLGTVTRRVMAIEAAKRMAITAIALKRYQLKHGNYPSDLKALVPEFLAAVPLDPVDGKPLRYRLNTVGTFLLYSVGPNGNDDGGNPQLESSVEGSNDYWLNARALDWVWPQPATAAEIQNYYAHPPK